MVRTAWGDEYIDYNDNGAPRRDSRPSKERDSQALVFASLAEELAERLDAQGQPPAATLAARGRSLASRFRATANETPDDEREGPPSLVGELIEFHRTALDVLGDAR